MEQTYSAQQTTTRIVTDQTTVVNPSVRFDRSLILTLPCLLKIAEMLFSILGLICVATTDYVCKSQGWFNTVAWGGLWNAAIVFIFYLFHIIDYFNKTLWLEIELIYCTIWCLCNLIAAIAIATCANYEAALGFAAFFGFGAMIAYGRDAHLKYTCLKNIKESPAISAA